jgi:methylated-DNA-protein-cysteine methyltransferase-like protein
MDLAFVEAVLDIVRHIPEGRVLTYGDVAADAGRPGRARLVGRILASGEDLNVDEVPWWRVVPASRVPIPQSVPRLKLEGSLTEDDRVDLKRVRWTG